MIDKYLVNNEIDDILHAINAEPIEGLDILMYVKNGKIYYVLSGE